MRTSKVQEVFERALAHHGRGELEAADQLYRRILREHPRHAEAIHHRGLVAHQSGRADEAIALIRRAVEIAPSSAALGNLSVVLQSAGRSDDAAEALAQARSVAPESSDLARAHGDLLLALGRFEAALEAFEAALALQPDDPALINDRGNALAALQRWEDAHEAFDRALALDPQLAIVQSNRGNAAFRLGREAEALADHDAALARDPGNPDYRLNRATALGGLGRHDDALDELAEALRRSPADPAVRLLQAHTRLLLGRLDEGWRDHEARREGPSAVGAAHADAPQWRGEPDLTGKTLLLHWEQGFGDTLQFCRYAPLAKATGARIVLQVQAPLKRLLQSLDDEVTVIGEDETPPPFDLHCPLLSLPLAYRTTLDTIPAAVPYLSADPARTAEWAARLGPSGGRPRLGLGWKGAAGHLNDRKRSLPQAELERLLALDVDWVSLQKDPGPDAAAQLARAGVLALGDDLADFADSAALIANLDGVVSVDTSLAHLAGALGKPLWILLPFTPDWRWLVGRTDTPWYPTARLIRQPTPGDWASVIDALGPAIAASC